MGNKATTILVDFDSVSHFGVSLECNNKFLLPKLLARDSVGEGILEHTSKQNQNEFRSAQMEAEDLKTHLEMEL